VRIGIALMAGPRLTLLDEPSLGLLPPVSGQCVKPTQQAVATGVPAQRRGRSPARPRGPRAISMWPTCAMWTTADPPNGLPADALSALGPCTAAAARPKAAATIAIPPRAAAMTIVIPPMTMSGTRSLQVPSFG
jgi:hypothetical protein